MDPVFWSIVLVGIAILAMVGVVWVGVNLWFLFLAILGALKVTSLLFSGKSTR